MPPRGRQGLSSTAIIAIVVVVVVLVIGGYFLQKALLAKPGTFGYSLPNYQYVVPPSRDQLPSR